MAEDNGKTDKGFSGLASLISDLDDINEFLPQKPVSNPSESRPVSSPREEPSSGRQGAHPGSAPLPSTVEGGNERGTGLKWLLCLIGVIVVLWLYNEGQSGSRSAYSPPPPQSSRSSSQSETRSRPQSAPSVTAPKPEISPDSGAQWYARPPFGTDNVLSVSQIRWCVREGIRIEAMRDIVNTREGVAKFNRIVEDYNRCCASFRYRHNDLTVAEQDVEPYRSQIVSEARKEAGWFNPPPRSLWPSESPRSSVNSFPRKSDEQRIREVQRLLTGLGYKPGKIDGQYGRRTADAVRAFQRDIGMVQDGKIDENLLDLLKKSPSRR